MPPHFEHLAASNFDVIRDCTSDSTVNYNCIAWAVGKTDKPWWPVDVIKGYHWPLGLPVEPIGQETIENFVKAFETEKYEICTSSEIEVGFEKVVIYADANMCPLHAARSLAKGVWTSKIGDEEDIEHATVEAISGNIYGSPVVFLKRPIPS